MIYWIEKINNCLIGMSPKPVGFDNLEIEILEFKRLKINTIISLLEHHEIDEFGLMHEKYFCDKNDIAFINLPIKDNSIPNFEKFTHCIENVYSQINNCDNILIHCNHGLGRSGLFMAGILIKSGMSFKDTLKLIELKRGFQCPSSPSQLKFLKAYENLKMK